ncbi:prostaglandin E receptor 4 (subtype EP4) c [Stegostoma tigrinum]|uniref:prostaglandin E receptor 4 (subtype EP4) c n=1 Tax=Stegostoma tigrinum TaxID=3053191 RepID=UPI0028709485|nr:prostaglandin E receptor 4 (subtype EP4) c [Stegostoma tigrinum]
MVESVSQASWEEVSNTSINGSTMSLNIKSSQVVPSASMFTIGVVGNLIAIVVLCVSKKEQKETTFYTLVCGLAVTDLLGTCCTSPVVIATYLTQQWPGGQPLCHFFSFSMLFFGSAGMTILCTMSIERYLAINHAFFYSQYIDKALARLTLLGVYLLNLVFCILPFFGLGSNVRHFPGTWCFLDWRSDSTVAASYTYIYGGFSAFLILVTVLCNLSVCVTLISMRKRAMGRRDAAATGGSRSRRFPNLADSAAEMQMFWLLVLMTIVFLVCSIPLVIRIFVNQLYGPAQLLAGEKLDYRGDLLAIRFASFNPILDPWVYILCRKKLLTMGCERLKRTVGAARDGQSRRVGWASGQQTPLSSTNSIATSYASLQIKDENKMLQVKACHRTADLTHSFTDFTNQQLWEAVAHPFSIPNENHTGITKTHSESPPQSNAILCTILKKTMIPDVSVQNNAALSQERRTFDILNLEEGACRGLLRQCGGSGCPFLMAIAAMALSRASSSQGPNSFHASLGYHLDFRRSFLYKVRVHSLQLRRCHGYCVHSNWDKTNGNINEGGDTKAVPKLHWIMWNPTNRPCESSTSYVNLFENEYVQNIPFTDS